MNPAMTMSRHPATQPLSPTTMGKVPMLEIWYSLIAAVWRRRYVIALPIVLMPLLGAVIGHFMPRSFETRMSILIQEPSKLNPFLEDLSVKTNLKDRMDALRALLTSRYVMAGVAEDLGLLKGDSSEAAQDRVVADLAGAVSVQLIGNEMVELRYRAASPFGIDRVLMRIGERFMQRVAAPEDSSMRSSVTFLEAQLKAATDKLGESERALSEFKTVNAQQLPDLRSTNVQRLAQLRDALSDHEIKLTGAESEFKTMRSRLTQADPMIGRLEQDIIAVTAELAQLRARYTDQHSSVQTAMHKLERLNDERASLLRAEAAAPPPDEDRILNLAAAAVTDKTNVQPLLVSQVVLVEAARARLQLLRSETDNLRGMVAELTDRVKAGGEVERSLRDHEREVQVNSDLVAQLRHRFDMAKITGDLSRNQAPQRIAVIDRPTEPMKPTKPITLLFTLAGLVAGIVLGAGLAALMEIADTSVRSIRDMESLMGVPVLARIIPSHSA